MAIRVNTNYHTIYPPTELTDILNKMQIAGALAKSLGEDKIYNDLKGAYNNLKNQWESSASEMCEKKSRTNWLGGGDIYARYPCDEWEGPTMNAFVQGFKTYSKQQLVDLLNASIRELNNIR